MTTMGQLFYTTYISVDLAYFVNITFPERVIVDNIILRNKIINQGAAEVNNHISRYDLTYLYL